MREDSFSLILHCCSTLLKFGLVSLKETRVRFSREHISCHVEAEPAARHAGRELEQIWHHALVQRGGEGERRLRQLFVLRARMPVSGVGQYAASPRHIMRF
jgi:hypothetical protein